MSRSPFRKAILRRSGKTIHPNTTSKPLERARISLQQAFLQFMCTKLHLQRSISAGGRTTAILISVQSVLNRTRNAGFARGCDAFVAQTRRIISVLQGGSRSFLGTGIAFTPGKRDSKMVTNSDEASPTPKPEGQIAGKQVEVLSQRGSHASGVAIAALIISIIALGAVVATL